MQNVWVQSPGEVRVELKLNGAFYREMRQEMDKKQLKAELQGEVLDLVDELDYDQLLNLVLQETPEA